MTALVEHSATELLALLAAGRTTSVELTQASIDRINRHDSQVQAFVLLMAVWALISGGTAARIAWP